MAASRQQQLLEDCKPEYYALLEGMLSKIELEIITACNLKCYNCDRSSRQAPTGEMMDIAQIAHFVDESMELDWRWRRISLLGGEPTLHPSLFEILEELNRYRLQVPSVCIQVVSNGYGEKVTATLERLPVWVNIRNTQKTSVVQDYFDAYNVAPEDLEEYRDADFSEGCAIPYQCGMALTRYGFYPCGAGASIDRIWGWGRNITSLRQVTPQGLVAEFSRLCRHCGHFHGRKAATEVQSASWNSAYDQWRSEPPQLPIYPSGRATVPVRRVK
jgi:Radical SAM superfamily/4Fe-4S single cluster domain